MTDSWLIMVNNRRDNIYSKLITEAMKDWDFDGVVSTMPTSGMLLRSGRRVGQPVITQPSLQKRLKRIASLLYRLDLWKEFSNANDIKNFSYTLACLMNFLRIYCQDIMAQLPQLTHVLLVNILRFMDSLRYIKMVEVKMVENAFHKLERKMRRLESRCDYQEISGGT
jgi:hypothetical protein